MAAGIGRSLRLVYGGSLCALSGVALMAGSPTASWGMGLIAMTWLMLLKPLSWLLRWLDPELQSAVTILRTAAMAGLGGSRWGFSRFSPRRP
jgi:hypothetical protein